MYCVGLTGNIASGKSTALSYFADQGIVCLSADAIAREITDSDVKVLQAIRAYFGEQVILASGALNRRALRQIIFSNPRQRRWLEELLHPLIRQKIQDSLLAVTSPYCVIEIPLLFDKEKFPYLNRILLLTVDKPLQIARIMQRDHCSDTDALSIIQAQPEETVRKNIADDILSNNQSPEHFKAALAEVHHQYLLFAKK